MTADLDQPPFGAGFDEISALRRIRFEIWSLGLSDSRFVTIVTLRSESRALRYPVPYSAPSRQR